MGITAAHYRIYYYTRYELRHVWTEPASERAYPGRRTLCHKLNDILLFAQLYNRPTDAKSASTLWQVCICTLNKDGCSNRETLNFYLEVCL